MKKLTVMAFVLLTVNLVPVLGQDDSGGYPEVTVYNTQVRSIYSEIVDQGYSIFVALPDDYAYSDEVYPVLYLLDSPFFLGTVTDIVRNAAWYNEMPELIIVGIGFSADTAIEDWPHLRERDFSTRDGAGNFLRFFNEELIPFINAEYRTDPSERAIVGHSAGGTFSLYALFHSPETFNRYISISPYWAEIGAYESEYAASHTDLPARVFLATGTLEAGTFADPSALGRFSEFLEDRHYGGLEITMIPIEDTTHTTVFPGAVTRGLNAVYCWDASGCSTPIEILLPVENPVYQPGTMVTTPNRRLALSTWPQVLTRAGTCSPETEAVVLQVVETSDGQIWLEIECDNDTGWAPESNLGE